MITTLPSRPVRTSRPTAGRRDRDRARPARGRQAAEPHAHREHVQRVERDAELGERAGRRVAREPGRRGDPDRRPAPPAPTTTARRKLRRSTKRRGNAASNNTSRISTRCPYRVWSTARTTAVWKIPDSGSAPRTAPARAGRRRRPTKRNQPPNTSPSARDRRRPCGRIAAENTIAPTAARCPRTWPRGRWRSHADGLVPAGVRLSLAASPSRSPTSADCEGIGAVHGV